MYHYVRPQNNFKFPNFKGLNLERFKDQIEFFRKNFRFGTTNELLDCIYLNSQIKEKSIFLTFDDGFKDHFKFVFPILKKLKIEGMFFPVGLPIKEKKVLDVHKIQYILSTKEDKDKILKIIIKNIVEFKNQMSLENPEYYIQQCKKLHRYDDEITSTVKQLLQFVLPKKFRIEMINILFQKYISKDEKEFSEKLYITKEEIKEMKEEGMFFGSHTYSHEWLNKLNKDELSIEIKKSNDFHNELMDNKNKIMCYPYGGFNNDTIDILKKYHYKLGLTVNPGNTILSKINAFTLNRYDTNDFSQNSINVKSLKK